jgi:ABC-type dipeptide/oligopeptide/nickel transport system ATPase component
LATICRPEFIIADEPTTALDVVVQKGVLSMIREVQQELGSSILFVTHDMTVHANMTDRLGIMYAGRLVEEAPTRRDLRQSAPSLHGAPHPEPAQDRRSQPSRRRCPGAPPNLADPPLAAASIRAVPWRWTSAAREPGADHARPRPPRRLLCREFPEVQPRVQPVGHGGGPQP